jgi:hypothetical protein
MSSEVAMDQDGRTQRLSFVFDCGSFDRERRYAEIDALPSSSDLDLLFVSHLDADHVNGIDFLLARRGVQTVVLPCLDALRLTVVVCRSLDGPGITGDFLQFLKDPVTWFAERGVKRVVFVKRDRGELPTSPADTPFGPGGSGPIVVETGDDRFPRMAYAVESPGIAASVQRQRSPPGSVHALVTEATVVFHLLLGHAAPPPATMSWILLPHVQPFEPTSLAVFRAAVRPILSVPAGDGMAPPAFVRRLIGCLRNARQRASLRSRHGTLASDHNEVSLSLYSGPGPFDGTAWDVHGTSRCFTSALRVAEQPCTPHLRVPPTRLAEPRPGWLCTGDANLRLARTRSPWLDRFGPLFDKVGVFGLPHHGSALNVSGEVLDRLAGASRVACAGAARARHPHPDLVSALDQRGLGLWQVSEAVDSGFGTMVTGPRA